MRKRLAGMLVLWLAAATFAAALPQLPEMAVARAAKPIVALEP